VILSLTTIPTYNHNIRPLMKVEIWGRLAGAIHDAALRSEPSPQMEGGGKRKRARGDGAL
jgi:hypothetical protein